MKKYGSLLYHAICVNRRMLLLKAALTLGVALLCVFASVSIKSSGPDMAPFMAQTVSITMFFVSCIGIDLDTFTPDVSCGWMMFSYTMPVTAKDRVVVRELSHILTIAVFGGIAWSMSLLCCGILGEPFCGSVAVFYFAMVNILLVGRVSNAAFTMKARNMDEIKTFGGKANTFTVIFMFAFSIVGMLCCGISPADLFTSPDPDAEISMDLADHIPGWLIYVVVPLAILLIAADAFFAWHTLRYATPSDKTKANAKAAAEGSTAELLVPRSGLTGYLYKEYVQNRRNLLTMFLIPFFGMLLWAIVLFLLSFSDVEGLELHGVADYFRAFTSPTARVILYLSVHLFASSLMLYAFSDDNKRMWLYYVASMPDGVRRFLYSKYTICFVMSCLFFLACYLTDGLMMTLGWFTTGEECVPMISVYLALFFYGMFENSTAIPLILRFGEKTGNLAALILRIGLLVLAVLIFRLLPEEVKQSLFDLIVGMTEEQLSELAGVTISLLPCICIGTFIASYSISCKTFLKGANAYVK